jgi:hypothetical protein
MTERLRSFAPDGAWRDFRVDAYAALLHATAYVWVANLAAVRAGSAALAEGRVARFDARALRAAYKRATVAIPQLPMEVGNNDERFERCRWRHEEVPVGTPTRAHCEHPWSKKRTREIVEDAVPAALARGIDPLDVAAAIAEVLDARQDTVLLPSDDEAAWGVRSERDGDGLAGRYADVAGRIVDRRTGERLSAARIGAIEAERAERVRRALAALR